MTAEVRHTLPAPDYYTPEAYAREQEQLWYRQWVYAGRAELVASPGDFLTVHDDETGGRKRLVAYVLNLTPIWRPDWGGALNFLGPTGWFSSTSQD